MDARKRARLESKGWHVGDVQQFLGLSDVEIQAIEMRERLDKTLDGKNERSDAKPERSEKPMK